jgi:hypothetical protein
MERASERGQFSHDGCCYASRASGNVVAHEFA